MSKLFTYIIAPKNAGDNVEIYDSAKSTYPEIERQERFKDVVFRRSEGDIIEIDVFGDEILKTPFDATEYLFLKVETDAYNPAEWNITDAETYKMKLINERVDLSELKEMKKDFWL